MDNKDHLHFNWRLVHSNARGYTLDQSFFYNETSRITQKKTDNKKEFLAFI